MVFLRVFQGVADQLHPQSLDLDFFDFFSLERQFERLHQSLCVELGLSVNLEDVVADLDLLLE